MHSQSRDGEGRGFVDERRGGKIRAEMADLHCKMEKYKEKKEKKHTKTTQPHKSSIPASPKTTEVNRRVQNPIY